MMFWTSIPHRLAAAFAALCHALIPGLSAGALRRMKLGALLLAVALVTGAAFAALQGTDFFRRSEWRVFDAWMNATTAYRPLAPGLAVVDISDDALREAAAAGYLAEKGVPLTWPWRREVMVYILAYLYACGVDEVYVDIIYAENRDFFWDDQYQAIAAAMKARFAHNSLVIDPTTNKPQTVVFTPTFETGLREEDMREGVVRRVPGGRQLLSWSGDFSALTSPDPTTKLARLPNFNAFGILRNGRIIMAEALGGSADNTRPLETWEGWNRTPENARRDLDAWLAKNPAPPDAAKLRGRKVVIGGSAAAMYDLKRFPVSGTHPDPGMLIHVTRLSNDMQDSYFREVPAAVHALVVIGACLLTGAGLCLARNAYAQVAVGGLVVAGVLGGAYLLFVNLVWVPPFTAACAVISTLTLGLAVHYLVEGRQRQLVSSLFGTFVSDRVLQKLIDNPEKLQRLGGDRMACTIMFSDLSGFTDLTEQLTQRDQAGLLVDILNDYFTQMSAFVINSDGYVDKYIGDAMMAVYGVPDAIPDHATRACFAALDCVERMGEFAPRIEKEFGVKLYARYGINTGDAVVGLMGSLRKINYTVIGDAVNLASRLEGANKPFGTTIMIGEETYALAKDDIEVRPIANLIVKGKLTAVRTYELLARAGGLTDEQARARQTYWQAFEAFGRREWDAAEAGLRETIRILGADPLSEAYLKSIAYYRKNPPAEGWQGIFKLDEK
ncbi:hypothetical protein DB346_21315 [Verrucomicrobia bacterium LW23]|nr:hypothetical protein DB346_21315 [Verrucomicrobia bacterium LW23]